MDTLADLALSCNEALEEFGFPTHPLERYRRFVGNGADKLIERALPEEKREPGIRAAVREAFNRRYAVNYLRASRPYPGIPQALSALKAAGVRLCVVSNKPHAFAQRMVEALFPDIFSVVFGNRPGVPVKPDPAAVHEALARLSLQAQQAVYIGDSDVDVQTGHNAGMPVIGCLWGFRGEAELRAAGADRLVRSADALLALLL